MPIATVASAKQQQPQSTGMTSESASSDGNSKSIANAKPLDKTVQSVELSPFPGTSLKLNGFPLWVNASVLGLTLLVIAGVLLIPKSRRLFGWGDKQVKPSNTGLILLVILGTLFGFFLRHSLPSNTSAVTRNVNSHRERIVDSPSYPTALYSQYSAKDNSVRLQWLDRNANNDGYRVERKSMNGAHPKFVEIAVLSKGISSYIDLAINPGALYEYRVASFNKSGKSYSPSAAAAIASNQTNPKKSENAGWMWVVSYVIPSFFAVAISVFVSFAAANRLTRLYERNEEYSRRQEQLMFERFEENFKRSMAREIWEAVAQELDRRRSRGIL